MHRVVTARWENAELWLRRYSSSPYSSGAPFNKKYTNKPALSGLGKGRFPSACHKSPGSLPTVPLDTSTSRHTYNCGVARWKHLPFGLCLRVGSSSGLVEKIDKTSPQKDYNKTSISKRVHMHNTMGTLSLLC